MNKWKILFLGANFSGLQEQVLRALMKKIIDINIFNVNVDKYKIDVTALNGGKALDKDVTVTAVSAPPSDFRAIIFAIKAEK